MNAVRHILSGQTKRPNAETILALSKVLGCTIGELLDEEKPASINKEQQIKNLYELSKASITTALNRTMVILMNDLQRGIWRASE